MKNGLARTASLIGFVLLLLGGLLFLLTQVTSFWKLGYAMFLCWGVALLCFGVSLSAAVYRRFVCHPPTQHADLATYLDGYATALRRNGREEEARAAETRAAAIRQGRS